jgi:hypothetical protein
MAAGDMSELVRDHALHFIGAVGRGDQPGMDVDDLPARHERIDRAVPDQHDLNILRPQSRCLDKRARHVAEQVLGLRIAQYRLRRGGLEYGREAHRQQHQQPREQGRGAAAGSVRVGHGGAIS